MLARYGPSRLSYSTLRRNNIVVVFHAFAGRNHRIADYSARCEINNYKFRTQLPFRLIPVEAYTFRALWVHEVSKQYLALSASELICPSVPRWPIRMRISSGLARSYSVLIYITSDHIVTSLDHPGAPWYGAARFGTVRHGLARFGTVRHGFGVALFFC